MAEKVNYKTKIIFYVVFFFYSVFLITTQSLKFDFHICSRLILLREVFLEAMLSPSEMSRPFLLSCRQVHLEAAQYGHNLICDRWAAVRD